MIRKSGCFINLIYRPISYTLTQHYSDDRRYPDLLLVFSVSLDLSNIPLNGKLASNTWKYYEHLRYILQYYILDTIYSKPGPEKTIFPIITNLLFQDKSIVLKLQNKHNMVQKSFKLFFTSQNKPIIARF